MNMHVFICVCVCVHTYITISSSNCTNTEFPDSLSLSLYSSHPSLLAGLLGYILCLYRADVNKSFTGWPMRAYPRA